MKNRRIDAEAATARTSCTMLRLSDDEMDVVMRAARLNGLTVAAFTRQQVLLSSRAQLAAAREG